MLSGGRSRDRFCGGRLNASAGVEQHHDRADHDDDHIDDDHDVGSDHDDDHPRAT